MAAAALPLATAVPTTLSVPGTAAPSRVLLVNTVAANTSLPVMDIDTTVTGQVHQIHGDHRPETETVRHLNFAMNNERQLEKIVSDTNIPDFSFEVNDSGKSINVKCSAGAYQQVVKPFFSEISNKTMFSDEKYNLTCVNKINFN